MLDRIETYVALSEQVEQPTGRGHQYIDTVPQSCDLRPLPDAAKYDADA